MHAHSTHARGQEGFGIVVVALLFTAFAVIAATMLDRSTTKLELERQQQIEAQLSRLSIALLKYARYNDHRFPCPASMEVLPSNVAFGAASPSPPTMCATGYALGGGTYVLGGSGGKLITGMVPVRDLVPYGVSYSEAFDPWGSRIAYVVHRDLTYNTSNATVALATNAERALVTDYASGQSITPEPDAVLISYGRDRMGGRLRSQSSALSTPPIGCSATERRGLNCDGDRAFIRGPLAVGSRTPTTVYFDDTLSAVRYMNP